MNLKISCVCRITTSVLPHRVIYVSVNMYNNVRFIVTLILFYRSLFVAIVHIHIFSTIWLFKYARITILNFVFLQTCFWKFQFHFIFQIHQIYLKEIIFVFRQIDLILIRIITEQLNKQTKCILLLEKKQPKTLRYHIFVF